VAWWSKRTGMDLGAFFGAYLREAKIPVLELTYDPIEEIMLCSWKTDEAGFDMPIKVGDSEHWIVVQPAKGEDVKVRWTGPPDAFKVATDLYYVNVKRRIKQ